MSDQNPFANREIAGVYEDWYHTHGKRAADQEKQLIGELVRQFSNIQTILEIGCGTGYFMDWLKNMGYEVHGADLSCEMIEIANQKGALDCVQTDARAIPFPSGSYDLVLLITTLEFVSDSEKVLSEVLRVAKKGVVLGVINRHSLLGLRYRMKDGPIWKEAKFFTISELVRILSGLTFQKADIDWKTTLWWLFRGALKLPWGGFIGMSVKLSTSGGG